MIPGIIPRMVSKRLIQKSADNPFLNATAKGGMNMARIISNKLIMYRVLVCQSEFKHHAGIGMPARIVLMHYNVYLNLQVCRYIEVALKMEIIISGLKSIR